MAIRDATQIPQPTPTAISLPSQFPRAPAEILKRFPTAGGWIDEIDTWYRRVRSAVANQAQDVAFPLNQTIAGVGVLNAAFVSFKSETETAFAGFTQQIDTVADDVSALAQRTTDLEAMVDGPGGTSLTARVAVIEAAYVDADEAQAIAVTELEAVIGTADDPADPNGLLYAKLKNELVVRAQADGLLHSSYTLTATAGNVITGMRLIAESGVTNLSAVIFQADKFLIYNPNVGAGQPMFEVSGTGTRVLGSITISQVSDAGDLASADTIDLASSVITNKSLANLDATANSKLSGIQAGATVGAAWGTNLTGRPVELTDGRIATALNAAGSVVTRVVPSWLAAPGASGLYLGSDRLGFYNGTEWRTYMDNAGKFYLTGTAGNSLAWDGSTLSIAGTIAATSGTIGGFTITATTIGDSGGNAGDLQLVSGASSYLRVDGLNGIAYLRGGVSNEAGLYVADFSNQTIIETGVLDISGKTVGYIDINSGDGTRYIRLHPGAPGAYSSSISLDGVTITRPSSLTGGLRMTGILEVTGTGDSRMNLNRFAGDGLDINYYATGDRYAVLDFHAQSSGAESARIIRDSGANAGLRIENYGGGDISVSPIGGYVRFGEFTATATAVAGYMMVKDAAGNLRKLAVLS